MWGSSSPASSSNSFQYFAPSSSSSTTTGTFQPTFRAPPTFQPAPIVAKPAIPLPTFDSSFQPSSSQPSSSQPSSSRPTASRFPTSLNTLTPSGKIQPINRHLTKEDWKNQVLSYVSNHILILIFPDEKDRQKFMGVDEKGFLKSGLWYEAFTDPTYVESTKADNEDPDFNYEMIELRGDKTLGSIFEWIFGNASVRLDPDETSKMIAHYASNAVFAEIVHLVFPDLPNFIRIDSDIEIDDAVIADVFEANFGALKTVSERTLSGTGEFNCRRLLARILSEWFTKRRALGLPDNFEWRYKFGDFKTQSEQIFTRNNYQNQKLPAPASRYNDVFQTVYEGSSMRTEVDIKKKGLMVMLTRAHMNFLSQYKPYYIDRSEAVDTSKSYSFKGEGTSKEIASRETYEKLYNWLNNIEVDDPYGGRRPISTEWSKNVKAKANLEAFPSEYLIPLYKKMQEDGYTRVYFEPIRKHKKEGHQFVVQLRGILTTPDGRIIDKPLRSGRSSGKHQTARRNAIEKYIGYDIVLSQDHPWYKNSKIKDN